jgi:hypothetical protein
MLGHLMSRAAIEREVSESPETVRAGCVPARRQARNSETVLWFIPPMVENAFGFPFGARQRACLGNYDFGGQSITGFHALRKHVRRSRAPRNVSRCCFASDG